MEDGGQLTCRFRFPEMLPADRRPFRSQAAAALRCWRSLVLITGPVSLQVRPLSGSPLRLTPRGATRPGVWPPASRAPPQAWPAGGTATDRQVIAEARWKAAGRARGSTEGRTSISDAKLFAGPASACLNPAANASPSPPPSCGLYSCSICCTCCWWIEAVAGSAADLQSTADAHSGNPQRKGGSRLAARHSRSRLRVQRSGADAGSIVAPKRFHRRPGHHQ